MKDQQTELIENQDVHNMTLHEQIRRHTGMGSTLDYLRVPNGWIVTQVNPTFYTSDFVPYSNEFNRKKPAKKPDTSDIAKEIYHYLSDKRIEIKAGNRPLKESREAIIMINKLLVRYKKEDILKMIDYKAKEAKQKKDFTYFRATTVFRPGNFSRYMIDVNTEVSNDNYAMEPTTKA